MEQTQEVSKDVSEIIKIPLDDIDANEDFNCRGKISPVSVIELARSIDANGLQQPVVVREYKTQKEGKKYQLVSGYRRFMAHIVLKRTTINAAISQCDESQAMILNLTENLQRENLNILEEAQSIKKLLLKGLTQQQIGNELKKSRGWVEMRVHLLYLPEDIQKEAAAGLINTAHITVLYMMEGADKQREAVRKIKEARERGEKLNAQALKTKMLIDVNSANKTVRKRVEIFEVMETISKEIGKGLHTRCLAWAAGEISYSELIADVKLAKEGRR